MKNRQVMVAELPKEALESRHFALQEVEMPVPGKGEVLLRIADVHRRGQPGWMKGATYRDAVNAGDVMPTYAICEVVESNSPTRLAVGDIVGGEGTWADYIVRPAHKVLKMPPVPELTHLLSVYGIAGKTAFHGLIGVGQAVAGRNGSGIGRGGVGRRLCRPDRQGAWMPCCGHRGWAGKM